MARDGTDKLGQTPNVQDATLRSLVGYNVKRAQNVIRADLNRTLDPLGLRMITFSALTIIGDNPGLSQSQLAQALNVERPNLVVIVDELEDRDLITRERVPTDRRIYALHLTDTGAARLDEAMAAVRDHEQRLLKGMSADEEAALVSMLRKIEGV